MSLSEDMARLTGTMREAHDSRVAAVAAMHKAVEAQIADVQSLHREMATTQRKDLQQFAETLRHNVSTLIHDLDVERATLNADQRRRLDAFTRDLRQDVSGFLRERAAERRAADTRQHQSLDDFMSSLRKRTSSFLAEVHAARMVVHADQENAQQAWQQFSAEMQQRRAGQPKESVVSAQHDTLNPTMRKNRTSKRPVKATEEQG